MKRFRIFNTIGAMSIILLLISATSRTFFLSIYWFVPIPVVYLYVIFALNYVLPGYEFIRKWFFELLYEWDVKDVVESTMNPLIAYPIMVFMDFELKMTQEYVTRGHDSFATWFPERIGQKTTEIVNNLQDAIKTPKERGWKYTRDLETDALMKEALEKEYQDIANEANNREFLVKWRQVAREKFVHKSSKKKRLLDEHGDKLKYEWQRAKSPEEILEKKRVY